MPLLSRLSSLFGNLFRKSQAEQDLKDEVDGYQEMLIEMKIEQGIDPAEARRQALIEMGGVEQVKEQVREVKMGRHLEILWQDVNYAARSLRKHALLSITVIATLTLGIGVSAGVFGYFNAEFLRPRVDKDHDSFVRVYPAYTKDPMRPGRPGDVTLEDYLAFRDRAKSLNNLAAYGDVRYVQIGKDNPIEMKALLVTSNFFSLYDPGPPLMGRLLQPEDCAAASPVVVLGERLWRNRFDSDPQIIGKVIYINSQPLTVVGVTPTFTGELNGARAWLPYTLETYLKESDNLSQPGEAAWLNVEGRLNPGFSRREAAEELRLIASQQDRLRPGRITTITVTDGSDIQDPTEGGALIWVVGLILWALTLLVLIVCVNVTTLLLARAAARRQEIAVRLALGAGRMRLFRMLLTETLLLASVAGLASLYLAYRIPEILLLWLVNQNSETVSDAYLRSPDWRVFGYLTLMTLLAGTLTGLAPALQSLKVNLSEMLKGRSSQPGGAGGSRLYGLLIGAQVALSFVLLFGAGLFVQTSQKAATLDSGIETRQVLVANVLMRRGSAEKGSLDAFHRALTTRLEALQGVQSVAYADAAPFNRGWRQYDVQSPGQPMRRVRMNRVSPNYFSVLGIPIMSGRAIVEDDPPCGNGICPVVVSQRLANELWPNENPLGKPLRTQQGYSLEVVGVSRDVSIMKLGGNDEPMIYHPWEPNANHFNPFVRFSGDGVEVGRAVIANIRDISPDLYVSAETIESFREMLIDTIWRMTKLIVFICSIAVLLAIIGIYGVVSFAVAQRAKEMGIRIAFGAQSKDIYRAVLGSCGRPVALGVLIGFVFAVATFLAVESLTQKIPFMVDVRDPLSYIITTVLLAGAAVVAMLGPARRATRIDPMMAIRDE